MNRSVLLSLIKLLSSGSLGAYIMARILAKKVAKRRAIESYRVARRRLSSHGSQAETEKKVTDRGELDCRRKWAIVTGGATDHAGEVCIVKADTDLSKTIFHNLTGIKEAVMSAAVAIELYWSEAALQRITAAFTKIPLAPDHNKGIIDFMENDCNFAMEHADGNFMDHLQFCFEYSNAHFKSHSPRVLFLHSILGVGTNYFPMQLEKEPKLKGMLTDDEFKHIEAFPSILRLLYMRTFIDDLTNNLHRIDKLKTISFHKVIDNKQLTLTANDLWVQLNYQVCHQLDFLPAANWGAMNGNNFLQVFLQLYGFLNSSGKLEATVNFDLSCGEQSGTGLPLTLGGFIMEYCPTVVVKKLAVKAMIEYSGAIGHSLNYTLEWEP